MEFCTPYIAIGDVKDAQNIRLLKQENIQAVLSVMENTRNHLPLLDYEENGILWQALEISDNVPLPPEKIKDFYAALGFLNSALSLKRNCLVHCWAGISRSAIIISAWLRIHKQMSWDEALWHIKRARSIVRPQPEPYASVKEIVDTLISPLDSNTFAVGYF